jgi:hypothetical protein
LAKFGVKKGTELKPEQFDDFEVAIKPLAEAEDLG